MDEESGRRERMVWMEGTKEEIEIEVRKSGGSGSGPRREEEST